MARFRLFSRRRGPGATVLRYDDIVLDAGAHVALRGRREIELTPTESSLLGLFLDNPERVLERAEIFMQVWGFDFDATSNLLNVYVGYLRRKLELEGEPRLLHTVRGVGYVLRRD
jgi:two-component system response regulator MprA